MLTFSFHCNHCIEIDNELISYQYESNIAKDENNIPSKIIIQLKMKNTSIKNKSLFLNITSVHACPSITKAGIWFYLDSWGSPLCTSKRQQIRENFLTSPGLG